MLKMKIVLIYIDKKTFQGVFGSAFEKGLSAYHGVEKQKRDFKVFGSAFGKLLIAVWRSSNGVFEKSLWSDFSRFTSHHLLRFLPRRLRSSSPVTISSPISSSPVTISPIQDPIFKISLNLSVDFGFMILGFPDLGVD